MTAPQADGGPAFPQVETLPANENQGRYSPEVVSSGGMSLRDYFAGQALIALYGAIQPGEKQSNITALPGVCYKIADAMLAARQTEGKK